MVSGAVLGAMPANIYATMTTIAATIVSQLDSAMTDSTNFAVKTLAEVGLVLMVITLLTNGPRADGSSGVTHRASGGTRHLTWANRLSPGPGSYRRCPRRGDR